MNRTFVLWMCLCVVLSCGLVQGEEDWEITPESKQALERGLQWLAINQGEQGNWQSNDLGLVSMGVLAFLSAGHTPGRGPFGKNVEQALDYIISNAKPSGLLNISDPKRDMYNHGLATFVLGQAYGMSSDPRIHKTLDRALKLIVACQCEDGGWDYQAQRQRRGHDLSLVVMQAKALRSAVDIGLEVSPQVVLPAIRCVREYYAPKDGRRNAPESEQRKKTGRFTYSKSGTGGTPAMAAAGVVCLQEFGQYDDWRIPKNMDFIDAVIERKKSPTQIKPGELPFDAYTLYYLGQAIYQVGGEHWQHSYPILRDYLVKSQTNTPEQPAKHGKWNAGRHVGGKPGDLYGTSVACFILAIPNRFLPILQEGEIESLRKQYNTP